MRKLIISSIFQPTHSIAVLHRSRAFLSSSPTTVSAATAPMAAVHLCFRSYSFSWLSWSTSLPPGDWLFYYFIKSEGNPVEDPLLLWLAGGPGCSAFSGLIFEVGLLKFRSVKYIGSLPTLVYHPFSWSKVSDMILDSPVGAGFSFSNTPEGYWLIDHPQFLPNPLYIGADSYAGKVVPFITDLISQGVESGAQPLLNLKGYLIGNPITGEVIDKNAQVPYAHNMGIISDEIYESTTISCEGEDYENPTNAECAKKLQVVKKYFDEINMKHILEPKCPRASPKPKN
ncbi:putative peptidase S10, serine carboxypeptidase, alpha/Beta hydrolase [Dioscorea sansibarensis]